MLYGCAMSLNLTSKPVVIAATAGLLILGVGGYVWRQEHRPQNLEVYIFDLPSGRSMFVRTPDDYRVLIDGGSGPGVIRELTKLLPFYSRRVDALICTDPVGKNVNGLIAVLDRYQVDKVFVPKVTDQSLGLASSTDQAYEVFLERVKNSSVVLKEISAGDRVWLGGKVRLAANFPVEVGTDEDRNSRPEFVYSLASSPEILFSLKYSNSSLVFIGGASRKVQEYLATAASGDIVGVDVLVVSHSALKTNMSQNLLNLTSPKYLIYSKRPADHDPPDPSGKINTKNGTVHLVSDGASFEI